MYPEYMRKSIRNVEKTRHERLKLARSGKAIFPMMSAEERQGVLDKFHPDYKKDARKKVRIGPNKGENITTKVVDQLEAYSRIKPEYSILSILTMKLMFLLSELAQQDFLHHFSHQKTELMFYSLQNFELEIPTQ